jgi:hypothetical protein
VLPGENRVLEILMEELVHWGASPSTSRVISKHGHLQEGRAPRCHTSMQRTKYSMDKGIEARIIYLSCPSKWSKMHFLAL